MNERERDGKRGGGRRRTYTQAALRLPFGTQ